MAKSGTANRLTPRNLALIRRVRTEHGLEVTPGQLARWRGWRLIPPANSDGGRARWRPGLEQTIPENEVQQVATVARLMHHYSREEARFCLEGLGWVESEELGEIGDDSRARVAREALDMLRGLA